MNRLRAAQCRLANRDARQFEYPPRRKERREAIDRPAGPVASNAPSPACRQCSAGSLTLCRWTGIAGRDPRQYGDDRVVVGLV